MQKKTKVEAGSGQHDLLITREFDLPVDLLFKAYAEAEFVEQWMGTKVLKLDNKKHGAWSFETSDAKGNVVFKAHGSIHDVVPDQKIVRTFEMENAGFGPQLEFIEFTKLDEERSRLNMHIVFRSGELRDRMLQLPFEFGLNMGHNRLQEIFKVKK